MESREQGGEGWGASGREGTLGPISFHVFPLSCVMKGRCIKAELIRKEVTLLVG